ncbi:MAG: flavodoxin domain-containing protein [Anaerolineae bacterium]|nr:flavodoxin domain-containing protein [Anaerolineae bacterium]
MGKVLVLYYSETGRTKAMAQLVAEGAAMVAGIDVSLKSVTEATVDDLFWCDGIAVGAPTHLGSVPWEMKKWWDGLVKPAWQKVDGKFGCAFSSAGGLGGGPELACLALLTILMNYGFLVFGVTDYVAPLRTLHYGAALPGRPKDPSEKDICQRLGLRLAEWVAYYVDGKQEAHPSRAGYGRI